MSDIDGLNRRNEPEKISTSKKAEPQSHTHLLHNGLRPMGVWGCLPADANLSRKMFQTPNELSFGLLLFETTSCETKNWTGVTRPLDQCVCVCVCVKGLIC